MTILQKHLVFIPLFCIAFIVVFGGCVMLLWNWLMPELFGLHTISFWQAAGRFRPCDKWHLSHREHIPRNR